MSADIDLVPLLGSAGFAQENDLSMRLQIINITAPPLGIRSLERIEVGEGEPLVGAKPTRPIHDLAVVGDGEIMNRLTASIFDDNCRVESLVYRPGPIDESGECEREQSREPAARP